MKQLALVTWRLPQTSMTRLEEAKRALRKPPGRSFALRTCQRALVAVLAEDPEVRLQRVVDELGLSGGERFAGHGAMRHLARVASGLDALVHGEDQVPGQFREALDEQADSVPDPLRERLDRARSMARQARDAGGLRGRTKRSVLDLAGPLLPAEGPLAVLGTGTIARHAVDEATGGRDVHVVSRRRERASGLAADPALAWTRETFLEDPPPLAGLVLCTSNAEGRLLEPDHVERFEPWRGDTLSILDLGVPRNAHPSIADEPGVEVTTMAVLARRAQHSQAREEAIDRAEDALASALMRERRRRPGRKLEDRIVALRDELQDVLADLVGEIDADGQAIEDAWRRRAHGRLAHVAQGHLEAALRGDPPP